MRKAVKESMHGTIAFSQHMLDKLVDMGYRYVQVKGLTIDKHYDYTEPYYILLVPLKDLPLDQAKKDIYEPINSEILHKWASEKNEYPKILITNNSDYDG